MMINNRLLAIIFLSLLAFSCGSDNYTNLQKSDVVINDNVIIDTIIVDTEEVPIQTESHLSILIAGDFMQHGPQIQAALQPDSTYTTMSVLRE